MEPGGQRPDRKNGAENSPQDGTKADDDDRAKTENDHPLPEEPRPKSATPSVRPSGPPPAPAPPAAKPSNLRILFSAAWIALQLLLVLTADRRADGAFGFRMFPESSWITVVLSREVRGKAGPKREHVENGVWGARGEDGVIRRVTWYDRVPAPYWVFDREMPASYGAATQLARLQAALDDMAAHVPEDAETQRFLLEVTVRRNGREATVHQLWSRERALPAEERIPEKGP